MFLEKKYYLCIRKLSFIARVAKLVDAPDLGSGVLRRVGSSPITRTMRQKRNSQKKRVPLFFENRQCRQRLVKRRTGEARTVWAAIRRRCQFYYQNRQCEQQKVTRSTAPVVPRGLRNTSVVNFTIRIDKADSGWSNEVRRSSYRLGRDKAVLSISKMR